MKGNNEVETELARERKEAARWHYVEMFGDRTYSGSAIVRARGYLTAIMRIWDLGLDRKAHQAHGVRYAVRSIPAGEIRHVPPPCRDRHMLIPDPVRQQLAQLWRLA